MAIKKQNNAGNIFTVPPGEDLADFVGKYYTNTGAAPGVTEGVKPDKVTDGNAATDVPATDVPSTGNTALPDWYQQLIGGIKGQGSQVGGQQTTQQNALANLPGVSQGTKDTLNEMLAGGYKPSETVNAAMQELQQIIAQQPGEFQSQYMDQLNGIMNQILNRDSFTYDLNSDPMYQQLRQQYMTQGRRAMQDTMGQAAALTGGYGNSWAATAGQMAYDQHLQSLGERVPELYDMALKGYQLEGDQLAQRLDLLNDAYNREYGQYQDAYNRWQAERDYLAGRYDTERGFDYDDYNNTIDRWYDIAGMENDQYNADRSYALQQQQLSQAAAEADRAYALELALQMVEHGKTPSYDLLMQAGYSMEDIMNMEKGRSTSGTRTSSGTSTTSGGTTGNVTLLGAGTGNGNATNRNSTLTEAEKEELRRRLATKQTTGSATIGYIH